VGPNRIDDPGWPRRAWDALTSAPTFTALPADLRTIDLVGLRLPRRATVALAMITLALLFDYSRTFLSADVRELGRSVEGLRFVAVERAVLFGLIPLLIVVIAFRDDLSRYGFTLGDWRWGLVLMVVGCAVMTPLTLWFATLPDVRAYYGPSAGPVTDLLLINGLELTAVEFGLRGFLTFVLVRTIGPIGVLVGALPFVFGHLGKPELELFSTLAGGVIYGWLAWRTRSIVWGAVGHTYILTLVTVAATTIA
jgi:hypothetical protein